MVSTPGSLSSTIDSSKTTSVPPGLPPDFAFPSFSLGNGLVEISALTTLIGSKNAESLILGSRGAAGLVWAMMSSFGALSVIKACLAASIPETLVEAFGLRNAATDGAVGSSKDLKKGLKATPGQIKARRELGVATAIMCTGKQRHSSDDELNAVPQIDESTVKWLDTYAPDNYTGRLLQSCPFTSPPQALALSLYAFDIHAAEINTAKSFQDYISILLSAVKLIEVYILWRCGDTPIFWVTALPWVFSFVAAPILHLVHLSHPRIGRDPSRTQVDILAGSLPTPQVPGGQRTLLLGAPQNVRRHGAWRVIWAFSALICVATLISTYILLSREAQNTVYLWIGFQILWLILRTTFYHLAESADNPDRRTGVRPLGTVGKSPFIAKASHMSSPQAASRIKNCLLALSRHQVLAHPRGPHCYTEDVHSPGAVTDILCRTEYQSCFPPTQHMVDGEVLEVTITALLGDTLLSSASWFLGNGPTSVELYDSCLVELVHGQGTSFLVPCARVLSGPPKGSGPKDFEMSIIPNFAPRGGSNSPANITWWYWIPCPDGRWLQLRSEGPSFLGKRRATVLSEAEVTRRLQVGDLYVSLTSVGDVEDVVAKSRAAHECLRQLFMV